MMASLLTYVITSSQHDDVTSNHHLLTSQPLPNYTRFTLSFTLSFTFLPNYFPTSNTHPNLFPTHKQKKQRQENFSCVAIVAKTQQPCGRPVKKGDRCGIKAHQKWKPSAAKLLREGQCTKLTKYGKPCQFNAETCPYHGPHKKKRAKKVKPKVIAKVKSVPAIAPAPACLCKNAESALERDVVGMILNWRDVDGDVFDNKEALKAVVKDIVDGCAAFMTGILDREVSYQMAVAEPAQAAAPASAPEPDDLVKCLWGIQVTQPAICCREGCDGCLARIQQLVSEGELEKGAVEDAVCNEGRYTQGRIERFKDYVNGAASSS